MRRFALAIAAFLPFQSMAQEAPTLAQAGLAPRIAYLETNDGPAFELGLLKSLRALETGLQTQYDYGLGNSFVGLPLIRLPVSRRSEPPRRRAQPDTAAQLVKTLLADLTDARAVLAKAGPTEAVELAVDDLWFDINSDGNRAKGEAARPMLAQFLLGRRSNSTDAAPITIGFDHADQAWLIAYTHMLSGLAEGFLAFDPTPVLTRLATESAALQNAPELPAYYDETAVLAELATLEAEDARLEQESDAFNEKESGLGQRLRQVGSQVRATKDKAERARLEQEYAAIEAEREPLRDKLGELRRAKRFLQAELNALRAKLPLAPTSDDPKELLLQRLTGQGDPPPAADPFREPVTAIYVIIAALKQQPDEIRVLAMRDHWLAMIAQNRVFWDRVAKETDNDREWIPNAAQTSALPIPINQDAGDTWLKVLTETEAVLQGKLLVPHPFLPKDTGISLAAWIDDPSPIDLMEWVQGIGSYRYVKRGARIGGQYWSQFSRMTSGRAGMFAFYFN